MLKFFVILLFGLIGSVSVFSQGTKDCKGFFRWDVKTLTDAAGKGLPDSLVHDTSISALVSVHPPKHFCILSGRDGSLPRFDDEKKLVRIIAGIVSVTTEHDQDLHIVIRSVDGNDMMVGEIPDPDCRIFDSLPVLRNIYRQARLQLKEATGLAEASGNPVTVEVTGVLFWDARHWWRRGSAKNGREIHPVLSVRLLSK